MLLTCRAEYEAELSELLRAFLNDGEVLDGNGVGAAVDYAEKDGEIEALATLKGFEYRRSEAVLSYEGLAFKRQLKRLLKKSLYEVLSKASGRLLPYGSLTGIRPTKLAYELSDTYPGEPDKVKGVLTDYFGVSETKTSLIMEILENQKGIYDKAPKLFDVYIHIPFCPTRCSYCSFISADIRRAAGLIGPYVEYLLREMELLFEIAGGRCNALYIGGGTPTAVDAVYLERILEKAARFSPRELTVEAGRPDTVTKEKLAIIRAFGAGRISINPQSFNQKTLDTIGRNHSADDVYAAFELAKGFGFDINTDIIAMLPGEDTRDFLYTLERCIDLGPQNVTVHNLALKRGSKLKEEALKSGAVQAGRRKAEEMTDLAYRLLKAGGYGPYYMYRQKYMSGNLENCGYTLDGRACVYNVDIMEETHSVLAAGAGSISKLVTGGRIERQADIKDVSEYIKRFDEILRRKKRLFYDGEDERRRSV